MGKNGKGQITRYASASVLGRSESPRLRTRVRVNERMVKMAMSKKDFIALADTVRNLSTSDDGSSVEMAGVIEALADFCGQQNPRFNRQRWIGYIAGTNGKNGGRTCAK